MSRLVEKAKKTFASPDSAPSASALVRKAVERFASPAKEPHHPAPVPSGVRAVAVPRSHEPVATKTGGRNQLFFDSGVPVRFDGQGAPPRRFKQTPQWDRGDAEERGRCLAEIERLTAAIAHAKKKTDDAELEVRVAREAQIREMLVANGESYSEAASRPLLAMSAQQFAAVVRLARRTAPRPKLSARLFSADGVDLGAPMTSGSRLVEAARRTRRPEVA